MQYNECMQNKKILKNLITIISGYTFRTALQQDDSGNVFVLQTKNIKDNNINVDEKDLIKILFKTTDANYFIKENDVVISSRGNFKAGLVDFNNKTIASSSLYILRINNIEEILPEYLVIYLNSDFFQKLIKESSTGGVINTILKRDLENLEIIIPSIKNQRDIINIYKNNQKYKNLLNKKIEIFNKTTDVLINKLLKN